MGTAFETHIDRASTGYLAKMYDAVKSGAIDDYYRSIMVGDDELEHGLTDGRLVVDTRLRDALDHLRLPPDGERDDGAGVCTPWRARSPRIPAPHARRGSRVRR